MFSTLPAPQPSESVTVVTPLPAPPPPTEPLPPSVPPPQSGTPAGSVVVAPPPPTEHPSEPALGFERGPGVTDFQPTHVFILPATDSRLGPSFQSAKISVSTECLLDSVRIFATFPQPVSGAIFLKNQFSTCRKVFENSQSVTFDVPLRSPSPSTEVTDLPTTKPSKSSTVELCEATVLVKVLGCIIKFLTNFKKI